jgi:hypothetical protein
MARSGERISSLSQSQCPLTTGPAVADLARGRLNERCPYAFFFREIQLEFADGVLTAKGRVASFYLKQLLQTFLREVEGINRIDNQVDVVSSSGLSSDRPQQ